MTTPVFDQWQQIVEAHKDAQARFDPTFDRTAYGNLHQNVDGIRALLGDDMGATAERVWAAAMVQHQVDRGKTLTVATSRTRLTECTALIEALAKVG